MTNLYENIEKRTGGDIYIGVVGPVRTGKSTFIKKFMEALVIPNIADADKRTRTIDELPQSAAGRTVMTTQPNFIPRQGVDIVIGDNQNLKVRLVDCVGYMINGAQGDTEEGKPRMVKTPWFKQEIPFEKAARIGTAKVIREHSTIGVVVTTDGSISDIPRENYLSAEEKVITRLKAMNKPFVTIVNSTNPEGPSAAAAARQIFTKYNVPVKCVNCLDMDKNVIEEILTIALTQFPVKEISFTVPKWLAMQSRDFAPKAEIMERIKENFSDITKISEIVPAAEKLPDGKFLKTAKCDGIDYGTGCAEVKVDIDKDLYYDTLRDMTGRDVKDDWALMQLIDELVFAKREYDKIAPALQQVETEGYGIVMPGRDKLQLMEPEIVKQGSKYGIKLTAAAPSLHILRANITTTVSPIIADETNGEDMVNSMMKNFENNPLEIWQSNLFGNSLQELVNRGMNAKLQNIPQQAREKLAETVEKVVNEGCQGLICIIL
ncbi:MAG: stage IV sporulation protein A [Oscillospiraceae bacterium]|nr:stage IV sporulation protein A [Oscillospiraceae bacterium]